MTALLPDVDPDGLLEYSVVYTDRALNHMALNFQDVMKDISASLKRAYNAQATVLVPGSGTFGMEAVARQFANNERVLVLRNGWFSYRWSQILEAGAITGNHQVLKAQRIDGDYQSAFAPAAIDKVVATIEKEKPALVCAPHVETSAGMILPDDYITKVAEAVHAVGGLMVLDCIASGTIWVDMEATGVDVLISAPQKGWSGPPCCGIVMMSDRAKQKIKDTQSSSFACDLKKWMEIMDAYVNGGDAYHSTMPTESLRVFRDVIRETEAFGFDQIKAAQQELGDKVRALLESKGVKSVAAPGFQAPGVVVSYTDNNDIQNGKLFAAQGLQIAAGVPLMCDEGDDFKTFRLGLFGIDKLRDVERTVASLKAPLEQIYK